MPSLRAQAKQSMGRHSGAHRKMRTRNLEILRCAIAHRSSMFRIARNDKAGLLRRYAPRNDVECMLRISRFGFSNSPFRHCERKQSNPWDVIPGRIERCEPGISRFSDVQLHIVVRCFASPAMTRLDCFVAMLLAMTLSACCAFPDLDSQTAHSVIASASKAIHGTSFRGASKDANPESRDSPMCNC